MCSSGPIPGRSHETSTAPCAVDGTPTGGAASGLPQLPVLPAGSPARGALSAVTITGWAAIWPTIPVAAADPGTDHWRRHNVWADERHPRKSGHRLLPWQRHRLAGRQRQSSVGGGWPVAASIEPSGCLWARRSTLHHDADVQTADLTARP